MHREVTFHLSNQHYRADEQVAADLVDGSRQPMF
jgi:hypothetical protein